MTKKIIKFEKNDCAPCKEVGRQLDESGVEYETVNCFDNPEIGPKYGVRSLPTVILFDEEGNIEQRIVGNKQEELKNLITNFNCSLVK